MSAYSYITPNTSPSAAKQNIQMWIALINFTITLVRTIFGGTPCKFVVCPPTCALCDLPLWTLLCHRSSTRRTWNGWRALAASCGTLLSWCRPRGTRPCTARYGISFIPSPQILRGRVLLLTTFCFVCNRDCTKLPTRRTKATSSTPATRRPSRLPRTPPSSSTPWVLFYIYSSSTFKILFS